MQRLKQRSRCQTEVWEASYITTLWVTWDLYGVVGMWIDEYGATVEWRWQAKAKVQGGKPVLSVVLWNLQQICVCVCVCLWCVCVCVCVNECDMNCGMQRLQQSSRCQTEVWEASYITTLWVTWDLYGVVGMWIDEDGASVEWSWQTKAKVQGGKPVLSVVLWNLQQICVCVCVCAHSLCMTREYQE
jgi:hypothetical protein